MVFSGFQPGENRNSRRHIACVLPVHVHRSPVYNSQGMEAS